MRADLIVFDPNNYSQNVLTAARELQQVNNEIQSLENEAQMLINQARNLASLPYSALAQLEAQIQRTEQLLQQAQRIAYSVTQINQAFTTTYPQSYPLSTSATQLVTDAQTRWQNALAGFHDAMLVQAGAVQNLDTTRTQITALVSNQPVRNRRPAGIAIRQPAGRLADKSAGRFDLGTRGDRPRAEPRRRPHGREPGAGAGTAVAVPQLWAGLPALECPDVPLMRRPGIRATAGAIGLLAIGAAIMATDVHLRHSGISPGDQSDARAAGPNDALARELARCQAIGMRARDDAACEAAWPENRRRFFAPPSERAPADLAPVSNAGSPR